MNTKPMDSDGCFTWSGSPEAHSTIGNERNDCGECRGCVRLFRDAKPRQAQERVGGHATRSESVEVRRSAREASTATVEVQGGATSAWDGMVHEAHMTEDAATDKTQQPERSKGDESDQALMRSVMPAEAGDFEKGEATTVAETTGDAGCALGDTWFGGMVPQHVASQAWREGSFCMQKQMAPKMWTRSRQRAREHARRRTGSADGRRAVLCRWPDGTFPI